jgi:hypothetical protein
MSDTPTPNRTKIAAAAALLGASAVAAFVLGAGPAPSVLQLAGASHDNAEDVSGNCDETEHAADPECAGTPISDDDDDDGTTSTTVDDTSSTTAGNDDPAAPGSEIHTLDASGAGTVIYAVEGGSLRLVSATPASGWQVEVEQGTGPEIELDFRSGTQRVQVNVELEDGQARERVRFRDDADDTDVRTEDGVVREDSSGPGSGDDDTTVDDNSNSGPGSGSDDDADDDHSGSGHGGDDSGGDDHSGSGRDHPEDD